MADINQAFSFVMQHEDPLMKGETVLEPDGSVARFGVNSKRHPEAERAGFFEMPHDRALSYAEDLFKYQYWNPIMGYQILEQAIANKISDLAYNTGIEQGVKIAQRAVNEASSQGVVVDGKFGELTLKAVNYADAKQLLEALRDKAKDFYLGLVSAKTSLQPYLNGWLKRAAT